MPDRERGRTDGGWARWCEFVLSELERLGEGNTDQQKQINDAGIEFAKFAAEMRVKAGIWGAMAGAIPAIVIFIWWLVKG